MKERIQHFTLILLVLLIIVGGIAIFLNNASYNPDFSVIDAISGATKKTHSDNDKSETVSSWGYTKEDIALSEELFSSYTEEMIVIAGNTYRVLENTSDKNTDKIVLLSDKGNKEYQRAVKNIADYLKEQGYHVRIKECSETMMLSLVHAYFMEEKYPELGNLMPRDVIAREEWLQMKQGKQVYLDMSHLDKEIYEKRLKGVIDDCIRFLALDPRKEPIPVVPGIHYFMGGIWVDADHRTSMKNLYAAGECACQYHGANRLGGNSLQGALYGGSVAAKSAMKDDDIAATPKVPTDDDMEMKENIAGSYVENWKQLQNIMKNGLGIIRSEETLQNALTALNKLMEKVTGEYDATVTESENQALADCCLLGKAMLLCALERKESRGAHTRSDHPTERAEYQKQTIAELSAGRIHIYFQKAGEQQ